jgi:hypothetical protein
VPVASTSPDGVTPVMATPPPPKPKKLRPIQPAQPVLGNFFGFGNAPVQRPPQQPPPRPPGSVGRAASAPYFFAR